MSHVLDITNAMVAVIDAASLTVPVQAVSLPVTATKSYTRSADRLDLGTLSVTVIPSQVAVTAFDLSPRVAFDWDIAVWIEQEVDPTPEAVDPLISLAEDIAALFAGKTLSGTSARCIGVQSKPVDQRGLLAEVGVFAFQIIFTFRVTS